MAKDEDKTMALNNIEVEHSGNKIVLPIINGKPLEFGEAITWMERMREEQDQPFAVHYELQCSPLDGAVAFQKAIAKIYGWSQGVPTPSFFGDNPPTMVGVPISTTDKVNVPWGRIEIPGIAGYLTTGMKDKPYPSFIVGGKVKKKHAENVKQLIAVTEQILREDSIYRGKAIKVDFKWMREDDDFDPIQHAPKFMDLGSVRDEDLIFGDAVKASLNIGLFTPIEHSASCREHKVPLKRGILLHGPYGTGKTMTAYVSALKAVRNKWTFIYLNDVTDLREGLAFAAQYAPAVLFSEDIDRAVAGERSVSMDAILNTLDGVDTKGAEIITVLTTNHLENINPAMLRPGRLDTLVEVSPPDAAAASRLVSLYARDLLESTVNLDKVGQALSGKIPAFIREVTERAKIAAISRVGGADIKGKVLEVDLINAAAAMENHSALLQPRVEEKDAPMDVFFVPRSKVSQTTSATSTLRRASSKN